jgi:hypothetical protein
MASAVEIEIPTDPTPSFLAPRTSTIQQISQTKESQLRTKLVPPTELTTDFDLLRFHAAAHTQLLPPGHPSHSASTTSNLLITSPYNTPSHHLNISNPGLPKQSLLFALALTSLKPVTPSYATVPYTSALNFDDVVDVLRDLVTKEDIEWKETTFYVVVFRSQLKENIDNEYLYQLDAESHREACESGGLLKYWFGAANEQRRNLATCEFFCCSSFC